MKGELLDVKKIFLIMFLFLFMIFVDYIYAEELDKVVDKPNGDFGYGTLYDVATHFYKLGIKDSKK